MRSFNLVLSLIFAILLLTALPDHADARSATRDTRAKHEAMMETQAKMLGEAPPQNGPGADLRAIASPKKKKTTLTGFPEGTLPGDEGGASETEQPQTDPSLVVLAGDPLKPIINEERIGQSLNGICAIASHAGYQMVLRQNYKPSRLDPPYSYSLMNGSKRMGTLYFDRQLKLAAVQ